MTPDGSRSLAVEALAALAAGLLLGVVLVYLPLGLAAAAALDRVGQWQEVLGMSPPLRYRVFLALEEWMLPLAGIALAAIVVHVGVRRTLRRGVWFGDEPLWDAALSPAATSLLALALATVWFSADARRLPTLGGLAPLAAAAGGLALFLSLVGLAVGAFRRFRPARQALAVLIALLALLPLARVAADAWGGARLRALARSLQPEMEAERRRRAADRRPILRGPALEEDAAPRYRSLMARLAQDPPDRGVLSRAVAAGPGAAPSPEALAQLEGRRGLVAGAREAVRCAFCVWELKAYAPNEAVPSLLPARSLADLLVLEGHERAHAGDGRGATERYLDAVRLGCDFGSGSLLSNLVGASAAGSGVEAMGRLLVSESRLPLSQVAAELSVLESRLPTLATALREQRFQVVGALELARRPEDLFAAPALLPAIVPYRLLAAHAAAAADRRWREWEETVAARGDADGPSPNSGDGEGPAWNPAYRLVSPTLGPRIRVTADDLAARFAMVRSAVTVEAALSPDRHYPEPARLTVLPADPWAPSQPIRYEVTADRTGYRVWSVGMNRVDDGGTPRENLDLVLERPPR